jgi:F-type H+-transporting ATPase subunit a
MMQEKLDVGKMIFHHTADAWEIWGYPLPRFPDLFVFHVGKHTIPINLSPTKHVVFMVIAALLVFLTMKLAGRAMERQRAGEKAPKGFAAAIEGLVLWVRNDICIANIGHDGAKFAPLIISLFFFILYCNLMGLVPHSATPTGNLAITAGLAILVFLTVEISGFLKLGPKGYLGTIFPHFPGTEGPAAVALAVFMSPIELMSKLVKPFALAVRLFGNMTAGHFVILSLFGIVFIFGQLGFVSWGIGIVTAAIVLGVMLLEMIVAILQAYVFALLSAVFIGLMQHEH